MMQYRRLEEDFEIDEGVRIIWLDYLEVTFFSNQKVKSEFRGICLG